MNNLRDLKVGRFCVQIHTTPGDGYCLLHCVANAIYEPYKTGLRNGQPITRSQIVKLMRKDILTKLLEINPNTNLTNYESIYGGVFAQSASWNEKSKLTYLKRVLSSSEQLGEEVKVILEYFIGYNILVLDSKTSKPISTYDFNVNKKTIIVYFTELGTDVGHFELVSLRSRTGVQQTVFSVGDPFLDSLLV